MITGRCRAVAGTDSDVLETRPGIGHGALRELSGETGDPDRQALWSGSITNMPWN